MLITPTGRLLEITSWMLELNDKNVHTEKVTFKVATKHNVSPSTVRNCDFFSKLASRPGKVE